MSFCPPGDPGTSGCTAGFTPHPTHRRLRRWVVAAAMLVAGSAALPALAQSVGATAAPASPGVTAVAPPPDALAGGTVPKPVDNNVPPSSDPVSRFLSERGLINTRPVTALAQQVRERATDVASDLVLSAMDFLGVRYQRGGSSRESGFDCSGFTRHVFENSVGLILPRRAAEQANMPGMLPVNTAELKPGDLVFFNTLRHTFSHVGIYVGDNKFIHSPRAGGSVRIEDMRTAYWRQRFDGARRPPSSDIPALNALIDRSSALGRNDGTP